MNIKQTNEKVIINDDIECDLLIDCSYNKLGLSNKKYIYENTISFIYERINFNDDYDSLTIMDGDFFSLFPRDVNKKLYSLTHVKYTPFQKEYDITKLNDNLSEEEINKINVNMENDVLKYLPNFKNHFKLKTYFLSYKCKLLSNNDSRECIIEQNNNLINVNCGKIIGIFELEEYLKNFFQNIN